MLRKIACNSTNSGAIDSTGNVYVWGAGKYGLLGNPKQKNPIGKPIKLQLKSDKLILDYSSEQSFVATSLTFGQYHGAVVVNDINTNSDYNPLLYAENILKEFKNFLMRVWDVTVKKQPEHSIDVYASDQLIIEHTLKYCFRDNDHSFPYISVTLFKELMVNQAKMSFKDTVSYNRLFQDLADPNDEDRINLKELRDQLVGRRCGNGIVFTWGIVNEGRLGIVLTDKEREQIEQQNHDLVAYKPSIVKFDESVIILKVSSGNSFTLALSEEGLVYSWGLGNSGGLGQGEANVSATPMRIKYQKNSHEFQNIKDIACGSNHCLALDQQGIVYSWGNGQGGRLGHGDETGENIPKEIHSLRDYKITVIEAGDGNSAAITLRNELFIWGVGLHGRLGTGKTSNVLKPVLIEDLKDQKVEDIALGSSHTLCILRNGKAMCWGSSKDGKIGLETTMDRIYCQPKELVTLEKEKIFQFAAGPFHSLALTELGDIYAFGNSKDGKLGFEENKLSVFIPRKIPSAPIFQRKSGAQEKGEKFPLFNQYDDQNVIISQHQNMGGCEVVHLACGFNSTIFLLNDGIMFACGSNKYGQLGFSKKSALAGQKSDNLNSNNNDNQNQGQLMNTANDDGGGNDNFADNGVGDKLVDEVLPPQLRKKLAELESLQDVEKPTQLIIYHDAMQMKVKYVSAGYFHALAVTTDGMTFGWGRNDHGQLGMGRKDTSVIKPTRIKSLQDKKIVMVACGENFSLFLSDLGEVACSGFNEFGELGIGVTGTGGQDAKAQEELYDEQYQKQMIEAKIELTPKVIKGLESIGYISCGKNHAVAIRTHKRAEKELKLYTWGCGWYGQTGHGSWHNDYIPKQVKVPVLKDTKFIATSCGSKHTIALDTQGQIWFFGHKLSVGIEDFQDEKQLVPVRLEMPAKIQEPIKFISSGEEHNLAVSFSGTVYAFGRNTHNKLNASSKEYIYFETLDSDEKARITGCGANHSVLIDNKGVPYTWGYIANGRCGLKLENDDQQKKKEDISSPTVIYFMKMMFQKELQKIREILGATQQKLSNNKDSFLNQNGPSQQLASFQSSSGRFPIQRLLKDQAQSLDDSSLLNQDRNIDLQFAKIIEEFHQIFREQNGQLNDSIYNAQNAIISRIYTFPTRIEMLQDIKAELPKAIIRNKQIYEAIFTLLQVHPCYLINWITKTTVNRQPKEVISILKIVFGEKEIRNDPRILHLLMTISRKIFQFEMDTYDLKEILLGRSDSTFSQMFNLIFEGQEQNVLFINTLISDILHQLQKFFCQMLTSSNNKFHIRISNKQSLQYQFDYESVIQDNQKAQQRIRFLIEFMQISFNKMLKALDPKFKNGQKGQGATISNEIISLVYGIKEDIIARGGADVSQEEIDSYILNHVFEILFRKLQELNFDLIKDQYWHLTPVKHEDNQQPDKDIFNFSEKRNLVSVLADHMEKYLRKIKIQYNNPPVEVLKEFIANNKQNFRRELSDLLNFQPFNFDYLLVKDLFINSMSLTNSTLSISIADLIFIYNSLVEKGEIIFIQNHDQDPIAVLIQELGSTVIVVKENEKQFIGEDILECKMNLEIRQRLLITHDCFTKCFDCNAPVYEDLLPLKRFKEGFQGKAWLCSNPDCRERNDQKQMTCQKCQRYRDSQTVPKDQMFVKYRQQVSDPTVGMFQLILLYMPIIDLHQAIDGLLEYEQSVEQSRKTPDYQKLQIIETFKKHKDAYMFQNKKKNVNFEDAGAERQAEKETEEEFLAGLERQLESNFQGMKAHEKRIQEYYQLMKEIRDKISNYLQQQIQYKEELKLIIENAFTGLGSDFLKGEKQDIFAGKLHLKGGKKSAKLANSSKKGQQQSVNPQLENFFVQLDKQANMNNAIMQSNYQELQQNREIYKDNFGFFGKYPLYQLRQRKVLQNIQIHGKRLQSVMKKCSYVFYDDLDNGFRVELIYEESNQKCFVFGRNSHEAILETFSISKDVVAEMRRTMATKATIQFGNSEFNVFELVFLLNEIKSQTYSYSIENKNETKKGEIKGFGQGAGLTQGGNDTNNGSNTTTAKSSVQGDNKV